MSRLTNVARIKNRGDVKAKEYGNQTYRSGFDFATQMRVATEKSKTFVNPNLPESELVRPYMSDSYETMEYDIVPDAGLQSMPTADTGPLAIRFDVDWDSPTVANIAFEDAWTEPVGQTSTYSGVFYPAIGGDDGMDWGGTWTTSGATFYFGNNGNDNAFVRFQNITIPTGVTIISAKLVGYSASGNSGGDINVYFNNAANPAAPTSVATYNALALTSPVNWVIPGALPPSTWNSTPNLKNILQAVIDLGGWASGNSAIVLLKDNSGSSKQFAFKSFDSGSNYPQLQVTWEVAI